MSDTHLKKQDSRKGGKARNFIDSKIQVSSSGVVQPLSADKFLEIWKHYDKDASRYLEKAEVAAFLKDFLNSSLIGLGESVSDSEVQHLQKIFLEEFDENKDGKLSVKELTAILPVEESFFVLFRQENSTGGGTDYMKLWKQYDRDLSGFIEVDELKSFLRDLITKSSKQAPTDEKKLDDYTKTIMKIFDTNNDGKLGLSELIRLLPERDNFVKQALEKARSLQKLTQSDVTNILNRYDKNHSGTLEGAELANLATDLLELEKKTFSYNASDVKELQNVLLKACDVNRDGLIDKKELSVVLLAISNAGLAGIYESTDGFNKEIQKQHANYTLK